MAPGESVPVPRYADIQKARTMAMHQARVEHEVPLEGRVSSPLNMVGGMALLKEVVVTQQPQDMDEDWRKSAKCTGTDTNFFFPHGSRGSTVAKEYCKDCPVKQECLEYAIVIKEDHGVWGGASERDRRRIRRTRNIYSNG